MVSTAKSPSVYPIAQRIRPQLASAPNIAAFVRLEVITDFAIAFARGMVGAPVTVHSTNFVAPSPSPAIFFAIEVQISLTTATNKSKSAPSLSMTGFSAMPFAMMETISFVEVSPSTLTMLKVSSTASLSAFCSMGVVIAASVVRKPSMVAMLG